MYLNSLFLYACKKIAKKIHFSKRDEIFRTKKKIKNINYSIIIFSDDIIVVNVHLTII